MTGMGTAAAGAAGAGPGGRADGSGRGAVAGWIARCTGAGDDVGAVVQLVRAVGDDELAGGKATGDGGEAAFGRAGGDVAHLDGGRGRRLGAVAMAGTRAGGGWSFVLRVTGFPGFGGFDDVDERLVTEPV